MAQVAISRRVFVVGLIVISAIGIIPRAAGLGSEITYDEAEYAEAARLGLAANAFDRGRAFEFRHEHPPFLAYLVSLSLRAFGEREWAVRLPSFLASLLLIPVGGALTARATGDRAAGLFAALLLVASPAHTVSARVGDHHALAVLFLLCAMCALGVAIAEKRPRALIAAGAALALLVATTEFGVVVAGACALILALVPNAFFAIVDWPRGSAPRIVWPPRLARPLLIGALVAVAGAILLWPAGLVKLDLARSFFRYSFQAVDSYAGRNQMAHSPPTIYVEQYARLAPAYLVVLIGALGATVVSLARRRLPRVLLPAAFCAFLLTFTMHLQVPASFRYSLYAATLLIVLAAWGLGTLARAGGGRALAAIAAAVPLFAVLATFGSATRFAPDRPGFDKAARHLLSEAPGGGRVLSSSPFCLAFYLRAAAPRAMPPAEVIPTRGDDGSASREPQSLRAGLWLVDEMNPGYLAEPERRALEAGLYDWVVLDTAPGRNFADDPGVVRIKAAGGPESTVAGSEPGGSLEIYRAPVSRGAAPAG